MNKTKIILSATGGVIGVAVLAMAYLVWSAMSAKIAANEGDDESEGLEAVLENANRLSHKPIYPCAASIQAVASNESRVAEWKDDAFRLAARGDRPVKSLTSAQFKTDMVAEAKRLVGLPGTVQGKIAKPDFVFGPFKEYIAEGKMPSDARLPELQRQWDDFTAIVELLSANGAAEVLDLQLRQATVAAAGAEQEAGNKKKPSRKAKGGKTAAGADDAASKPASQSYTVVFMTKPNGFVKCLNAFETSERFFVVDGFSFTREADVVSSALGGGDKKDANQQTSSRRRRRAAVIKEEKTEDKPKNGIITDPLLDAPLKVELQVSTYDFKTLQEVPKEEVKK